MFWAAPRGVANLLAVFGELLLECEAETQPIGLLFRIIHHILVFDQDEVKSRSEEVVDKVLATRVGGSIDGQMLFLL
jgi:hypothetical protein